MQIVTDIPNSLYANLKKIKGDSVAGKRIIDCVINGTPLPKGHGDLVDRSKICKAIPAEEDNCTGMGMTYDEMDAYNDGIDVMYNLVQGAKAIIEADKAESEDKE